MVADALADLGRSQGIEALETAFGAEGGAAGWVLGALGFYFQLSRGFTMPWYLAIPLLPLTVADGLVGFTIGMF